jgi:phosphatidylserine/phosphatidylglycerophosphate/cardiolipin synthase-like enzyme
MTQDYWDTCARARDDERRVSYDIIDAKARRERISVALPLHDLFARMTGDAVADVEANFIERWNGVTTREGDVSPVAVASGLATSTTVANASSGRQNALTVARPSPLSPAGREMQPIRPVLPRTARRSPMR